MSKLLGWSRRARLMFLGLLALASQISCFDIESVVCENGSLCPIGSQCVANLTGCAGETCCFAGSFEGPACGNGRPDQGEQCDLGDVLNGNALPGVSGRCSANCLSDETCGNGVTDKYDPAVSGFTNEECDFDDAAFSGGRCISTNDQNAATGSELIAPVECRYNRCGDGVTGENQPGTTFPSTGLIRRGAAAAQEPSLQEDCDDGENAAQDDSCLAGCVAARCGDGVIQLTPAAQREQCDDGDVTTENPNGNGSSASPCGTDCIIIDCGNGRIDGDEECDDGNDVDTDACRNTCVANTSGAFCGNGKIESGQGCDDGTEENRLAAVNCTPLPDNPFCNQQNGDNCITPCPPVPPNGWVCGPRPEAALCQPNRCGDGVIDTQPPVTEECDAPVTGTPAVAGPLPTATCNSNCTLSRCGDGVVNPNATLAEQCEDTTTVAVGATPPANDGCSATCQVERFTVTATSQGTGTVRVSGTPLPPGGTCDTAAGATDSCVIRRGGTATVSGIGTATSRVLEWTGTCNGLGDADASRLLPALLFNDASPAGTASPNITCNAKFTNTVAVTVAVGTGTGTASASAGVGATCANATSCTVNTDLPDPKFGITGTAPTVTLTATPGAGSFFVNWTGGGLCTGTNPTLVISGATANQACVANFVGPSTARATVNSVGAANGGTVTIGGGTTGCNVASANPVCTVPFQADISYTATPAQNFVFSGWSGAGCPPSGQTATSTTITFDNVTADTPNCTATFTRQFAVSWVINTPAGGPAGAAGTVTPGTVVAPSRCIAGSDTCLINSGTQVALTATTNTGYQFTGFAATGGCTDSDPGAGFAVTPGSADITCTANYAVVTNTVSGAVTPGGSGTVTVIANAPSPACSQTSGAPTCAVNFGGSATFRVATTAANFVFTGWTGPGQCNSATSNEVTLTNITTAGNTCTANFASTFTVTGAVDSAAEGQITAFATGTGATCTGSDSNASCTTRTSGGSVTFSATAKTGFRFVNWTSSSAACNGLITPVITLTSAAGGATCTANFDTATFTITGAVSSGQGSVTGSNPSAGGNCAGPVCTVPFNGSARLTATPAPGGWVFTSWSGDCSGTTNPLDISSVTGNRVCQAAFSQNAPNISYPTPQVYGQNIAITTLAPTNTGGAVNTWAINPALPAGLSFSTTNGNITGTPTVVAASANYTVTATNAGGQDTFAINITVIGAPNISYPTPQVYGQGVLITPLSPNNGGGASTNWTALDTLPAGLTINGTTGVISGTPTAVSAATAYTIRATNVAGPSNFDVTISVVAAPNISYPTPQVYGQGVLITPLSPNNGGGASTNWTALDTLPAGLTINGTTGVISGTPTAVSAATAYTIRATNVAGPSDFDVTISVVAAPNISYPTPQVYVQNAAITPLSPTNIGGASTNWTAQDTLPAGLTINGTTGVISGTPTAVSAATAYTIRATNAAAFDEFDVNITVNAP